MDDTRDTPTDAPLNPALKSEIDTSHYTGASSPAPVDTASARAVSYTHLTLPTNSRV